MMRQEGPSATHRSLADRTRELADDYLEAGYVEMPDFLRAIASIIGGDCPVHGREDSTVPVDGREVDAPPLTAAELSRQSIQANAEKQQAAIAMGPGTPEELAVLKRFAEARRDRPTPADQIRRDEATRKELDNP